ncbi:MAG: hypothetical protein PF482_10910, partial [Desulfobacteraceae bacterium]|nr:hypothetical protein [Desulfobacteraceae bacterium]
LKENDIFVFKFNRLKDAGYDADKKMYHEKCISCHKEKRNQGIKSGPLISECRMCHTQTPSYLSSTRPFGLDKSLHYRHVISDTIKPTQKDKDENCGQCHHEFDKKLNKTIYIRGKEGTCRYCHYPQKTDEARSFKTVAHEDCLNCHYPLKSENIKAGPTDCAGCHDAEQQRKVEIIADIPRIKRNQPDDVLLSLWLEEAVKSKKPSLQFIQPVAFNHKSHEAATDTCYACHHSSMESCNGCHTRIGTEKSKYTRLGTAMHSTKSLGSCIGCHMSKLQDKNCSGCHSQMSSKTFSESNCNKCHTVDRKSLVPIPSDNKDSVKIAESEISSWSLPKSLVPEKDIPENVTINIMKDQYEGATFPHRKIVQALYAGIQKNKLAVHFHRDAQTMCTGCHHNSPASVMPPKCASCHGILPEQDGRPGLKGAYHAQCIGCHQEMGIEKPVATDCISCHKLQTKSAQQSD